MTDLRIALFLIGLAVIAGIYFWGTQGKRRKRSGARGGAARRGEPTIPIGSAPRSKEASSKEAGPPVDCARTLSDLSNLVAESGHTPARPGRIREAVARVRTRIGSWSGSAARAGRRLGRRPKADRAEQPDPAAIVLYVTAPPGRDFLGSAIRDLAEELGMRYGEMKVFHHHGMGRLASPAGLYCLVNMLEPGSFDLNALASCRTEGLALIMRLPAPVEARLCFELMLHGAHRLAEGLGGEVRDAERRPLGVQELARLRALAARAGV